MKRTLILIVLATFAIAGFAASGLPLVLSGETNLKPFKQRDGDYVAQFRGNTIISGRFVAQWVPERDHQLPTIQVFHLYPNEESVKRLPHFKGYPVTHIDITNGLNALSMAAGEQALSAFKNKKQLLLTTVAKFQIEDFVVGVECDSSWARATIVSVQSPDQMALSTPTVLGC